METRLKLEILPQPDETTCGPCCLHAVYRYYGEELPLDQVIGEVKSFKEGGTLEVFLAIHALKRGYSARIYTYNLDIFDPSWFAPGGPDIRERLKMQMEAKDRTKLRSATLGYLEFLDLGGELRFEDLTTGLIRKYLNRAAPVLAGLSSTYLYRSRREYGIKADWDDVRGESAGHFVVLCGYDKERRTVLVADPLHPNPVSEGLFYEISIDRVLCSILLGVLSYDANLLIITPKKKPKALKHADPDHC